MLPILQIGGFALQTAGLVIIVSIWTGLSLAERHSWRFRIDANDLYNLVFYALIGGVFGARLGFVLRFPAAFAASPVSLISLNPGLMDPSFGLFAAGLTMLIFGQRFKLPFRPVLDAIVPFLAVIAIGLPLANLATGQGYGLPTQLPWAIKLWGAGRHPSQIYEIIAATLLLIWMWPGRLARAKRLEAGYFLEWVILTAFSRLFLEAFRADSVLLLASVRQTQVIAWAVVSAGFYALWQIRDEPAMAPENQPQSQTKQRPGRSQRKNKRR